MRLTNKSDKKNKVTALKGAGVAASSEILLAKIPQISKKMKRWISPWRHRGGAEV